VTRRPGSRSASIERPRQKGWWGEPESDQIADDFEFEPPAPRVVMRKPGTSHPERSVTQVGRALTPGQIDSIRAVMRLFVQDDTANGIDPHSSLMCHRCNAARRAIGSIRYDRFTLCNECSIDYEILHARGLVDGVVEYLERFASRAASA